MLTFHQRQVIADFHLHMISNYIRFPLKRNLFRLKKGLRLKENISKWTQVAENKQAWERRPQLTLHLGATVASQRHCFSPALSTWRSDSRSRVTWPLNFCLRLLSSQAGKARAQHIRGHVISVFPFHTLSQSRHFHLLDVVLTLTLLWSSTPVLRDCSSYL
jgi:hypothetical protein